MAAGGRRVSYIDPELLQIIEDSMKTSTGYYMYEYDKKSDGEPSIEINFSEQNQEMQKVIIMSSSILSLPRFSVSFSETYRKGSKPAGTVDKIYILFSKVKIDRRHIINLDQKAENTDIYTNIQKFIDLLVELKICPDDLPEDFKRISTKGDGNCLFNAISYQLGGQETPQKVRRDIGTSQKMKTTDREWGTEKEVINASNVYNRTVIWFTYLGGILRFHIIKKATLTKPIVLFNCNLHQKNEQGNHWETIEISDERIKYIYLLYSLYMSVYDEPPVEGYIFLKFKYEYNNIVPQSLFDTGIDRSKTLLYQKTPSMLKKKSTEFFEYFIYYDFEKNPILLFFSNNVHCPHCFNVSTFKYICNKCTKRMFLTTVSYYVEDLTLEQLTNSGYIDYKTRLFKPDFQTLCNRKSEPNIPSGELLFKDEKCSTLQSLFTRIENRYGYRYNVYGFNIPFIRDILMQLPKIWKDGDLILYNTQSLKRSNTPTDVWKYGKEPGMLYPINLVHKPFFELHLDKNDNPLFLYSNIVLPLKLESQFRKSKKITRSKSLKNKKTNKSKSLKKLKNKKSNKSNKSKSLKIKKTKSLKNKKTNKFN